MPTVIVRFYAELNDALPAATRMHDHPVVVPQGGTVRDLLASAGVPEETVDLVLVNGESSAGHRVLSEGDRVSVYPVFESFDIRSVGRMRDEPLRVPAFVLDTHLGKLASYLRMLGFDTVYRNTLDDAELLRISATESRLLLSRDRLLINTPGLRRAYLVRATDPKQQLREVLIRFDLRNSVKPFTRCLVCNTLLEPVARERVEDLLPPRTREFMREFFSCPDCDRIYWKGSHYGRMKRFVDDMMRSLQETPPSA